MVRKTLLFVGILFLVLIGGVIAYNSFSKNKQQESYLNNIPEKPENFENIVYRISTGAPIDLSEIESDYYLQPDFYPNWEQRKDFAFNNHDYSRWGVHGYGTFPSEVGYTLSNVKEGDSFDTTTFLRTSDNIESYQGVKLSQIYNEYFELEFNDYPEPFILTPTFPEYSTDWAKKLNVTIKAKKEVPVGEYELYVVIVKPNEEFNNKMYNEIMNLNSEEEINYINECSKSETLSSKCKEYFMQRNKVYVPGGMFSSGDGIFKIKVIVE